MRFILLYLLSWSVIVAGPVPVTLVSDGKGAVELRRGGEPYFVKGAGGTEHLEALQAAGGNSIRTWSTENLGEILDRAGALGLTVTAGIWLGHERHGFNYQDGEAVSRQIESAREAIVTHRDHPALLAWAVGNEMEGDGGNPAVWYAVNHIARLAKDLDPHHPTLTVIAELGGPKVEYLHRFCPDIDMVGINTYGGIQSVAQRYREAGGTKPYLVTEFGPPGHWESGRAPFGAPLEMSSTKKAWWILQGYRDGIAAHPGFCLGSYVFLWGAKQEATATWYGLFLEDGTRLEGVEAMAQAWGGPEPENRCPRIERLEVDRSENLEPGSELTASLSAMDPDGKDAPLEVRWVLRLDSGAYSTGGDAQAASPEFPGAILSSDATGAKVRVPEGGGVYRLFAYVKDAVDYGAVANVPLQVRGEPMVPAASLPLTIYEEGGAATPYAPSGYMGNVGAIRMNPGSAVQPAAGGSCLEVTYDAAGDWGGVLWQSPANDWGDLPGGLDLTGATRLVFQARGAKGGEVVKFGFGSIGADKPYHDSGKAEREITLSRDWKEYSFSLEGSNLSRIKTGFMWTVAGQGTPLRFFLDEIRFE